MKKKENRESGEYGEWPRRAIKNHELKRICTNIVSQAKRGEGVMVDRKRTTDSTDFHGCRLEQKTNTDSNDVLREAFCVLR